MKIISTFIFSLFFYNIAIAKRFHIIGTFSNKAMANSIIIGNSKVSIVNDTFELYGYIDNGTVVSIQINNDEPVNIWLSYGEYKIVLQYANKALQIQQLKAPPEAQQFYEWQKYKTTLNNKFANNKFKDDSVYKYYTQKIADYAKVIKTNELLNYTLQNLPTNKYCTELIKKTTTVQNVKNAQDAKNKVNVLAKGKKIDDFVMKKSNDSLLQFHTIKAKYILLDFWGTWCGPCRLKHPYYVNLYNKYKAKGFEIVSIALDTDKQKWLNAIQKDKMNWINVSEFKTWNTQLAQKYGVNKVPFNVFLNNKFEIISTDVSIGVMEAFLKGL